MSLKVNAVNPIFMLYDFVFLEQRGKKVTFLG